MTDVRSRAIQQEKVAAGAVLSVATKTIDWQLALRSQGLDLLARSRAGLNGDVALLRDHAATLARQLGGSVALWQASPVPQVVFHTYRTEDAAHIADRAHAPGYIRAAQDSYTDRPVAISDAFVDPLADMPTVSISRKLTEGSLAGQWLSHDIMISDLSHALGQLEMPPGAVVTVVDGAGQIIASTADAGLADMRPIADDLGTLMASAAEGTAQGAAQTSDLRGATHAWGRTTAAPTWGVMVTLPPAPFYDIVPGEKLVFALILLVFLVLMVAYGLYEDKRRAAAIRGRLERLADRQKAEIALLARRVNRLQHDETTRGDKIAKISHDMRTSFLGVRSVLDALTQDKPRADQIFRLTSARTALCTISRLLDDLQQCDDTDSGTTLMVPDVFNPRDLLASLPPMITAMALRNGNRVVTDLPPDMPWLKGDAARIGQIVLNLLGNAAKFTRSGVIRLSAHVAPPFDSSAPPRLNVVVTDTGKGISATDLPDIFKPHFRTKSAIAMNFPGSGLGLAIVKEFVEAMNGTIAVHSEPGAGTTFRLSLPLAFAQAPIDKQKTVLRGVAVLVVDDDPLMLQIMTDKLHHAGARVHMASTRADAVAACRAVCPDVVVLDMMMPGTDGFALLRAMRAASADQTLLAVAWSANMTKTRVAECRIAGFNAAAQKDGDLVEVVARVLQDASILTPDALPVSSAGGH